VPQAVSALRCSPVLVCCFVLSLQTIDVLIKAVNEFKGAVMIISHDQHFLQGCMREFWSIHDRKLKVYDNLDACKRATYKQLGE
jgi:ATPase subunit of ABC transporter with duplicated ATPase domains